MLLANVDFSYTFLLCSLFHLFHIVTIRDVRANSLHNISSLNFGPLPMNETSFSNGENNITKMLGAVRKMFNEILLESEKQIQEINFDETSNQNLEQCSGDFSISGDFGPLENRMGTQANRKMNKIEYLSQIENNILEAIRQYLESSKDGKGRDFSLTKTKEGFYDHDFITVRVGFNEMETWDIIIQIRCYFF